MNMDKIYIERCIQLAKLGLGNTYPNPLVGAVIVHNDKIIGEGYHMKYGEAHAEVNAIKAVKDPSVLREATIYVSLEPCSHFGKTPPCADLIVKNQFKRVVIGSKDPFEKVNGKGIEKIKNAGIEVSLSELENDCIELNKRFFTFHQKKRPYIILKWAQTENGYIDIDRLDEIGVFWITDKTTKTLVHKWRTEEDAILIGANTLITDHPNLTARHYEGNSPKRIVIDSHGNIQLDDYWDVSNRDYVIGNVGNDSLKCQINAEHIAKKLYDLDIQSVIIEGGAKTLNLFIDAGIWDEARIVVGKGKIKDGILAPEVQGKTVDSFQFGKDHIQIIKK